MSTRPINLTGSDITLRQLQYLSALAKEKNLSAAARKCHVSQPALAEQLEKLESRLGKLVVRGRRTTTLTPLGIQVLEQAKIALAAVDEIERVARYPEAVRIGMIDTVAPYLMPRLMSSRPERIIPVQAKTKILIESLDDGRLDAAVLAKGTYPSHWNSIPVGADELLLAVPSDDAVFAKVKKNAKVPMSSAHDHEMLLLAEGHCLRDQVSDVCRTVKNGSGLLEAATLEMLVEMVARHLGVTLVPSIAAEMVSRQTKVRLLHLEESPKRELVIVSRHEPSDVVQTISKTLSGFLK